MNHLGTELHHRPLFSLACLYFSWSSLIRASASPCSRFFTPVITVKKTGGTAANFVGVAGKGTVKATQFVGKGTAKIGVKTVKGTYTATKMVAKHTVLVGKGTVGATVRVGKGTVGALSYLSGRYVSNLAGNTINGMSTFLLKRNAGLSPKAAWKTRVTSPITTIELQFGCHNLRRGCDAFAVIWQVPCGYGMESLIGIMGGESSKSSVLGNASLATMLTKDGRRKETGRIGHLPGRLEREVGRTEVIKCSRDPQFKFSVDFHFHEEQTYVVRIYDLDLQFCPDLKEHDFLGGAVFTLSELLIGKRTLIRPLDCMSRNSGDRTRQKSVVMVQGKEVISARSALEFRFSAEELVEWEAKNIIDSQDDQYFKIMKFNADDQTWTAVYKSEVVMSNNAPTWAAASLPLPIICNGITKDPIKICFWDYIRASKSTFLGEIETTVEKLVEEAAHGIPVMDVWKNSKNMALKKSGRVKVLKAVLKPNPTFLEYILGGCELDLTIAVDFSLQNGHAMDKDGFHYRPGHWHNDYQAAIHKLGVIMEPYSKDKQFTMLGFGATVQGESVPLFSLGSDDGAVRGAQGLLDAYDELFEYNRLFIEPDENPKIAPLIQNAMYQAIRESEVNQSYSVLCILTTCKISDNIRQTIDIICTAAEDAPLSIVVIGIGDNQEDLDSMKLLLANGSSLLHSSGAPIARNNVHFASFRDFNHNVGDTIAEALKEIPEQLVEHFTSNGIIPRQYTGSESES